MSDAPGISELGTSTEAPSISEGDTMSASSSAAEGGAVARGALERGALIGRYVILSKLGAGGMGIVLAAYDPELDRKIALKLLKGQGQSSARTRLQREAQALAKLDHRNVVSVHDVGVHEGQLFVAMEFVEGQTLGAWMTELGRPRPWTDVLKVFADAGRGLAAAHEAGLVHRDFKPDNVMLGNDGRVRVMDFGLARAKGEELEGAAAVMGEQALLASPLTQTGALLGTPAYMSAEQFEGKPADARSDQFGFCVSLHEALYGARPFAGKTLAELLESVLGGQVAAAPKSASVPAWIRAIVVRGLAPEPEKRWPSMRALLDALADDPAMRRRKWVAVVCVVGVLGGLGAGVAWAVREDAQTCTGFEERLAGVWDEGRRAEVQAAIEGTKLNYAPETWERVEQGLDEYTRQWVAARQQACEATRSGEQSAELLDLRMACLDERLQHVRATVDVLAAADETVVNEAVDAVAGLPRLERCADANALTASIPPPDDPEVAEQVATLEQQLVKAGALENAGKYADGLLLADAVVNDAVLLNYEPLLTRAWLRQGSLQEKMGNYEAAEATLEQAYESALGQKMVSEAAEASTALMGVVGNNLARPDDGRRWAENAKPLSRAVGTDEAHAEYLTALGSLAGFEGKYDEARGYHEQALALREQVFGHEHLEVAESLGYLGLVASSEGKYDEARRHHERALTISKKLLGPEHPEVARHLTKLGSVASDEGKFDEARGYHEQALAIREQALGPDHPKLAEIFMNLGTVAGLQGKNEEARAHFERALAILEKALEPNHPNIALALNNLGVTARIDGRYADARGHFERALAILEHALGPEHPQVAMAYINLGNVLYSEGKHEQARGHFERARDIVERVLGPEHPELATVLNNLGVLATAAKKYEEARAYHERALAIEAKSLGTDHPDVAYTLASLGDALLGEGKAAEALPHLERALTLVSANPGDPTVLARVHFALARALWDAPANAGRDRERARTLAEQARSAFAEAGGGSASQLQEVQAWQAKHGG
jgi:tetratricopeptide (TPR) repeat protein/predicted Ser/Thr protein kinase